MSTLAALYRDSLALLTDLYQVTMAYGYWKSGLADHEGVFHLTFRRNPFGGGYALACGLESVVELLDGLEFRDDDLDFLGGVTGRDGRPLFERAFLEHLRRTKPVVNVDALPEGTLVFPNEPLVRVRGPLPACQLLETPLLTLVNFATLVATKASRVCLAAQGDRVIEFGLRRAQGIDGGLSASRAAYVGGCAATSNVLAGKLFGIPVVGTHAHSWVMCFDDERTAFETYARAMPNNCVFLVDTYDTLDGVRNAIEVGRRLRAEGHEMVGVRLDSGDLATLSVESRKLLDGAGFPDARIVASNDLDERLIASLKHQGACITDWGVGTKLATAYDQPALGGVYKLGGVRPPGGEWKHRIKVSEQAIKISNPGLLQVRRYERDGRYEGDLLYDETLGVVKGDDVTAATLIDPGDPNRHRRIPAGSAARDLLVPIFRDGRCVYNRPSLDAIRVHAAAELSRLPAAHRRFDNPHEYRVGLEPRLHALKTRLIREARGID